MSRRERDHSHLIDRLTTDLKGEYGEIKHIADGGFGSVFYAVQKSNHKAVAIKMVSLKEDRSKRVFAEIEALKQLDSHQYVVKMYRREITDEYVYIVMEYCPGGSLRSYLMKNGPLSEKAASHILYQVYSAVRRLHRQKMIHRDLTTNNVLIKELGDPIIIRLCDFGLISDTKKRAPQTVAGTPGFMDPAIMNNQDYDMRVDLFSMGCLLYSMLLQKDPPRPSRSKDGSALANDMIQEVSRNSSLSSTVKGLIKSLLSKEFPDIEALKYHEFFANQETPASRLYSYTTSSRADNRQHLEGPVHEGRRSSSSRERHRSRNEGYAGGDSNGHQDARSRPGPTGRGATGDGHDARRRESDRRDDEYRRRERSATSRERILERLLRRTDSATRPERIPSGSASGSGSQNYPEAKENIDGRARLGRTSRDKETVEARILKAKLLLRNRHDPSTASEPTRRVEPVVRMDRVKPQSDSTGIGAREAAEIRRRRSDSRHRGEPEMRQPSRERLQMRKPSTAIDFSQWPCSVFIRTEHSGRLDDRYKIDFKLPKSLDIVVEDLETRTKVTLIRCIDAYYTPDDRVAISRSQEVRIEDSQRTRSYANYKSLSDEDRKIYHDTIERINRYISSSATLKKMYIVKMENIRGYEEKTTFYVMANGDCRLHLQNEKIIRSSGGDFKGSVDEGKKEVFNRCEQRAMHSWLIRSKEEEKVVINDSDGVIARRR